MRHMEVATLLLSLSLTLGGCAASSEPSSVRLPVTHKPTPVTYQKGELNRESLFELLAAEIAGQQRQFDTSLNYYLHQAQMTQDPAIAERATRIAQFLRNADAVLTAAALWSQADPQALEPLYIQTHILMAEGRFDEAAAVFRDVLATAEGEDSVETVLLIGTYSPRLSADAARVYEQMLAQISAKEPDRLDVLLTRALLRRRMDDTEGALMLLNRGLLVEPGHEDLNAQKIEILRLQGKTQAALNSVRTALKANPGHKQLRVQQAQLLIEVQPKTGLRQIRQLIRDYPEDTQLHYYFALLLLDHQQNEASQELLTALLKQNPDNSNLHFYLGIIKERQGDTERALSHYLNVTEGQNLEQSYARALNLLNTPSAASEVATIISEGIQNHPELKTRLTLMQAEWLNSHDSREAALALLDSALAEDAQNPELLYTRALLLGDRNPQQMLADLRQAWELEPDNPMLQNALGYSLAVHTKNYTFAHTLISQALEQRPNDAAVLDSMGWVLYKLGRTQEALNFLRRAWNLFADPEVSAHLIEVLWASGEREQARALLQQQLAEYPDNSHLEATAHRLGVTP